MRLTLTRYAAFVCVLAALALAFLTASLSAGAKPGNSLNAKDCQKGGYITLARSTSPGVQFSTEEECTSWGATGGTIVVYVPATAVPTSTSTPVPTSTSTPVPTSTSTPVPAGSSAGCDFMNDPARDGTYEVGTTGSPGYYTYYSGEVITIAVTDLSASTATGAVPNQVFLYVQGSTVSTYSGIAPGSVSHTFTNSEFAYMEWYPRLNGVRAGSGTFNVSCTSAV